MAALDCEILIIGAGVAGSAAAFHLVQSGVRGEDIHVIESGEIGRGGVDGKPLVSHGVVREGDIEEGGIFSFAKSSGTAVFADPVSAIKMIVNVFPCSADAFIRNHGVEGARMYLQLAYEGLELEKELAKQVLDEAETQLCTQGSLYVCLEADVEEFEREFQTFVTLGARDVELWDRQRTQATAGPDFFLGIFFPNDAAIDSAAYSRGLLRFAAAAGVRVTEGVSPVVKLETIDGVAHTTLTDGTTLQSKHAVLATGGLFTEANLTGIITPAWSYLTAQPEPPPSLAAPVGEFRLQSPNSVNFFSWGFTHDWCLTKGYLRCSGEDHFSALKPPRAAERTAALAAWTSARYPYLDATPGTYGARYGVYSETPDHMPLVGVPHPDSRICYLLGCNAWGQASLSYATTLVPGLLGIKPLSAEQQASLAILDIKRFVLLPAVLGCPRK